MSVEVTGGGGSASLQEKNVTPSAAQQIILPDSGYDGMSKLTVVGSNNLVPAHILRGKTIFGVTGYANDTADTGVLNCTLSASTASRAMTYEILSDKIIKIKIGDNGNYVTNTRSLFIFKKGSYSSVGSNEIVGLTYSRFNGWWFCYVGASGTPSTISTNPTINIGYDYELGSYYLTITLPSTATQKFIQSQYKEYDCFMELY